MKLNLAQIRELYSNYGAVDFLFIDGQPDGVRELAWKLQPDTLVTRGAMATPGQKLPDPAPKFEQKDDGLNLDIMRAQRIYNNSKWPNPIVVKLTAVELAAD